MTYTPPPPREPERQVFHIYVDESSKSASYFGVGAVFCRRDAAKDIADFMSSTAAAHHLRDGKAFRWNDLTKKLLPAYSAVGTVLVQFTRWPKKLRYRALIMESRKVDKKLNPNDNPETILSKFMFTLPPRRYSRSWMPPILNLGADSMNRKMRAGTDVG
jgi:hypothetical protein